MLTQVILFRVCPKKCLNRTEVGDNNVNCYKTDNLFAILRQLLNLDILSTFSTELRDSYCENKNLFSFLWLLLSLQYLQNTEKSSSIMSRLSKRRNPDKIQHSTAANYRHVIQFQALVAQ